MGFGGAYIMVVRRGPRTGRNARHRNSSFARFVCRSRRHKPTPTLAVPAPIKGIPTPMNSGSIPATRDETRTSLAEVSDSAPWAKTREYAPELGRSIADEPEEAVAGN